MKFERDLAFRASKDIKAVTTRSRIKYFRDLALLDTPGFNDPEKHRTDKDLFIDFCAVLNDKHVNYDGIAAFL
jgi:hypothetical protein